MSAFNETREKQIQGTKIYSPAPRNAWAALLGNAPSALPEQTPDWIDAMVAGGKFSDASRLYQFSDGKSFVLPLARRRGLSGIGGWLQSFPNGWGIGGVLGDQLAVEHLMIIIKDLRSLGMQRIDIRPDPLQWDAWSEALRLLDIPGKYVSIPRCSHVAYIGDGHDAVWKRYSQSARRGVRIAERDGVQIQVGRGGELVDEYYELFMSSVDRWAAQQHEPRVLARTRAAMRDPKSKLMDIARELEDRFVVTLAYREGRAVAGSIMLLGNTAHDTRSAMNYEAMGSSRAGELVKYSTMKIAIDYGCEQYHLGESGTSARLSQFKEKFGAKPFAYEELRFERLPWTKFDSTFRNIVKRVLKFEEE